MITLKLQLVFESKPKMSHQEVTNYIIEHFPGDDIIAVASGPTEDGEVRLKLKQDRLTDQQRDWLHLDDIARYINDFTIDEPSITTDTPTLKPWQAEVVHDILANNVTKVSSNSHNRYYTENCADRQWYELHHLIDLDGNQSMYSDLTITQCSTEGGATQIKLSHNEVDDLLTILLQWRMDIARVNHEIATQKESTDINDEKPF